MAKKLNQKILKRQAILKNTPPAKINKTIKDIIKSDSVEGGDHSHWVDEFHGDAKITDESGWHNHIFLIGGKLIGTEHDGVHRHPVIGDKLGEQTRAHGHDIFVGGILFSSELGGAHTHDEKIKDGWIPSGGAHRHFIEVNGVTYESLLSDDILSVEIRKNLGIGIQSILLNKDRFLTFEVAANKAEELGFDLKKFEERTDTFVFTQLDSKNFKEMSLQTITLEDGIEAVIGVLVDEVRTSGNDLETNALAQSLPQEAASPVDASEEVEAFDDVQAQLTLGYVLMSVEQRTDIKRVKESIAKQFAALSILVDITIESTTKFIDKRIETLDDNDLIALCDRVNTGLVLLDNELGELNFNGFEVEIDKDLYEEITAGTEVGVAQALTTISSFSGQLAKAFKGTTFVNLQKLLNSVTLSAERFVSEIVVEHIEKALMPNDEMTREELRGAQGERSTKFGIEVVDGSALTFPTGFPEELSEYGDPVNLKFPFNTEERARNARVRFKQFANQIYLEEESRKIVHERIVRKELSFDINVSIDPNDNLDALLPSSLRDNENVTIVEASAHPKDDDKKITKNIFVPIFKQDDEEMTVFGIVLEPDVVDLHGDTYDAEAIKETAHGFMENFQNIKLQHREFVNDEVKIIESFIAPTDMEIDTPMGPVAIKKDTWLMKVKILSASLWKAVKDGEFTGFSIGAIATVTEL